MKDGVKWFYILLYQGWIPQKEEIFLETDEEMFMCLNYDCVLYYWYKEEKR